MAKMAPKNTIQKTYRFEVEQSQDLEFLSKCVGRTQNEIIVTGVGKLLFENRGYFIRIEFVKQLKQLFENHILRCREGAEVQIGSFNISFSKPENQFLTYDTFAVNRYEEVVFKRHGKIEYQNEEERQQLLEQFGEWIEQYVDEDDPYIVEYFQQRFLHI